MDQALIQVLGQFQTAINDIVTSYTDLKNRFDDHASHSYTTYTDFKRIEEGHAFAVKTAGQVNHAIDKVVAHVEEVEARQAEQAAEIAKLRQDMVASFDEVFALVVQNT